MIVEGHLYDFIKFIPNHPGEGIHDVYMTHYGRKDVTEEFEHYHFDNEPQDWLEAAKEKGYDPETGGTLV